jgi:hypothetical protein
MKKYDLNDFEETLKCECGGEFVYTGIILTSMPPQYPYDCNKCGKRIIKRPDGTFYEW